MKWRMTMRRAIQALFVVAALVLTSVAAATLRQSVASAQTQPSATMTSFDSTITQNAQRMIEEGRKTFRFDTFGDEAFWGDQLQLHKAIAGSKLGGQGPGLSPKAALGLGLKVDMDALTSSTIKALRRRDLNLDDPAVTLALLKRNAVV